MAIAEKTLLEIALDCIQRGWHVFPCWPETKKPMTRHGWQDAANDEWQIRDWWKRQPNANVAIACKPSNLVVVDIDHGLSSEGDLIAWLGSCPTTYAVRTGRRPEFGVQLYYSGQIRDVGEWKAGACSGQIKSKGGYVMAAGSIHPDSKERYAVLWDFPVADAPEYLTDVLLPPTRERVNDEHGIITENRNVRLTSIAGKLRNAGLSAAALEVALLQVNADRCTPPLEEDEVKRIAANAAKWELPEPDPVAVLGSSKLAGTEPEQPKDWRDLYHTLEDLRDAPPVTFLIDNFLETDGVTAIAAPVAQRKSIIAMNVAHSLLTGEKLFDYFPVTRKPEHVIYLCPEMGIQSFAERIKDLGLLEYTGKTLFCRTMSAPGVFDLKDLTTEQLGGAVVILDTAIRFLKGDESSSEDMRVFAESIFRLIRDGALSVVLLHHSAKGTKDSSELTLENIMRGSGELGAFLASCWATRLQDPSEPYDSASYIVNVKQRDFKSKPFEARADEKGKMSIIGEPGNATLRVNGVGAPADADGRESEALEFIRANIGSMSQRDIANALKERGINRSQAWVNGKVRRMK